MIIKRKNIVFLITQITISLLTFLLIMSKKTSTYNETFIFFCRYGTFIFFVELLLLIFQQKSIITIINIFFIVFVLFQFGIPICFAINPKFYTYHLVNFDNSILVEAAAFTIISFTLLSLFLCFFLSLKEKEEKKHYKNSKLFENEGIVKQIAKGVFILTAIVVIPLYGYVSYKSIVGGFSQENRAILSSSSIFNIARALYFSSGILFICYSKTKSTESKIIKMVFLCSVLATLVIGARGEGLTWLVAFLYGENFIIKNNKRNRSRSFKMILILMVLVLVSVYVATARVSGTISSNLITSIPSMFISELGFNFTSICYMMLYLPGTFKFQYGLEYVITFLSLIPETVDIFGISQFFRNQLPLYRLMELLHQDYYGTLDFGVGFSFNAEAYYNFSWFGVLMTIPLAMFLVRFAREYKSEYSNWGKYLRIIILRNILMFPRQMCFEFLNSLLYQIIFMTILIWFARIIVNKGR